MLSRNWWLVVLLAGLLAAPGAVRAAGGEPEAEPGAEGPGKKAGERDEMRKRIKKILKKRKAGEELTAEEKGLLEKLKAQREKRGKRPGRPQRGKRAARVEGLELVNAVDAVKLSLAQGHLAKGQAEDAVKVLEGVVKSSPDKVAVGYAHLALARIYKQKGENEKAQAELKKVTGPAVVGALAMMLAGGEGDPAEKLEGLLETAGDPLLKAVIIRRLSMAYHGAGKLEKLADLAERAAKLLSYKEALAALDVESKISRGRPGGDRPPWAGPGGRERMFKQMKTRMEARIKDLEADGKKEEAEKLRQRLERMEKMGERFRKGGGRRGPGAEGRKKGVKPMPGDGDIF